MNSSVIDPEQATPVIEPHFKICALSKAFDVHEDVFYKQAADGKLRVVRFGRSIRVPLSEIQRLTREGWK